MKTSKYLLLFLTILFFLNVFSQNYSHQKLKKSSQSFTEINPALIEGTVTDIYTGEGLKGVDVYAGSYSAVSDNLGYYILTVEPGVYDINYSKFGYENILIEDTTAIAGETLIINVEMTLILYPPSWVYAWPNDEDTECIVEWSIPYPTTMELYYDDGTADDYFIWYTAGNANAVKFYNPYYNPYKVIGGRIYVGDGSFPNGGNIIGSTFGAVIYDDDGVNGLPGTMLDSIGVTVNNYEWVEFSGLDADIYEGDFYLAMFQGEAPPDACPIGIDYTIPTVYRSYSYDINNNEWTISAYHDFMIRALISPDVKNKDSLVNREIKTSIEPDSYVVARFSNFDPNGSVFEGDTTIIADSVSGGEYIDQGWAPLPQGWYAYGIKTRYILNNGQTLYSDYAPSNIVGHLMRVDLTINLSSSNLSNLAHTVIQLTQLAYPYNNYYVVLDSSNQGIFPNIWMGLYDLYIYKFGYEPINMYLYIFDDMTINLILEENRYPPRNLYVDPLTSVATWDPPQITALSEDFNSPLFPPEGWTMESEGTGWFKTDSLSFPNFQIPSHISQFACVIDYQDTVNNNGCCDYLITPQLDLRESEGFSLKFDSYYTGENGQLAYVEYSLDNCATWVVLYTLSPSFYWEYLEIDLSQFSGITGPEAIWFAFHADDNGQQASGWAIDNVEVSVENNSDWPPLGYYVFLDDDTVAFTEETSCQFQNLTYGVEYEASVAALYYSGLSEKIYYTFESQYLYPPRNLHFDTIDNVLMWQPSVYDSIVPENLNGFNIYCDGVYQDYMEWFGGSPNDTIVFSGYVFLPPGSYSFSVTAVYDLTPYGFPGQTAESMEEGPVDVIISYGYELPFYEDWSSGGFVLNEWTTECDNWCVNSQTGNPSPSAEFQYDPVLTNYECSLVSYPLLGSDIIDGDIWLDFDLMLDSRFDTAVNEKMIVKIWENNTWHAVAEFINEGDIDWTSSHIDISEFAKDNDFMVGFFATGLNSLDIIGWYIDNIHVYRVCRPPFNLEAIIEEYITEVVVYLSWLPPGTTEGEWMSYNDGTFENAMASEEGGAGLAQVFTPPQYPCTITQVRFFVSGYLNYYQNEEVYVLTGDGEAILAGPYVVPGVENDWVTVDVDDVTITEGTFMVATFNIIPDGPFIGMDDSYYDATLYFGSIGDFTELGELGYFYIGCHEAYIEYEISDNIIVNSVLTSPRSNGSRAEISESNTFSNETKKPTRDLLGFNIFRNVDFGEFELIDYTADTIYTDTLYTGGWYCYYTTAVYDQCESDSSINVCVSLPPNDIKELGSENSISVYPNPAKDFVNIISTENINKITVVNFAGQKVFEKKISDETNILINTASYETGVYIIKIETENGIIAKRVAITK